MTQKKRRSGEGSGIGNSDSVGRAGYRNGGARAVVYLCPTIVLSTAARHKGVITTTYFVWLPALLPVPPCGPRANLGHEVVCVPVDGTGCLRAVGAERRVSVEARRRSPRAEAVVRRCRRGRCPHAAARRHVVAVGGAIVHAVRRGASHRPERNHLRPVPRRHRCARGAGGSRALAAARRPTAVDRPIAPVGAPLALSFARSLFVRFPVHRSNRPLKSAHARRGGGAENPPTPR